MKKTLDEIINRSDYKTINSALIDRCQTLAYKIRHKMYELELEDIEVNGHKYGIGTWRCYQGESTEAFAVKVWWDEFAEYGHVSLEIDRSYNLIGDFHCRVEAASGAQYLVFLNDARAIIDELDRIETDKVASIQQALVSTEDLTKTGSHD